MLRSADRMAHHDPDSSAPARTALLRLLGALPARDRPLAGRLRETSRQDGYVVEVWDLDLNSEDPVPALLARPRVTTGRAPAILYNHSHGGRYDIGKRELVDGREYLQPTPYARALTEAGFVVLGIDHWGFGERSHTSVVGVQLATRLGSKSSSARVRSAPVVRPSPQHLSRGNVALSTTSTSYPDLRKVSAAAIPAGPAPTIATSHCMAGAVFDKVSGTG